MRQLATISFGPVQPFIEAARRTRDLSQGSKMLLAAVQAAGRALQNDYRAEFLIPAVEDQSQKAWDEAKAANILVFTLPEGKGRDAVEAARTSALTELKSWLETATQKDGAESIDKELAKRQIESLIEVFAGWSDYADEAQFPQARRETSRRLAASKSLRFRQPCPSDGEPRPKSPLLPQFESVIPVGPGYRLDEKLAEKLQLDPRETLDGPSFAKRFKEQESFFSMKAVAASTLFHNHRNTPEAEELRRLCHRFHSQKLFGDQGLSVEETLFPLDFAAETEEQRAFIEEVSRARRAFLKAHNHDSPARGYLALIHADGDHMGAALSKITTAARMKEFSRSLGAFSREAERIVADHFPSDDEKEKAKACIFAGGDDVLAILPVETALDCASELAKAFRRHMKSFDGDHPLTLSAGAALFHHSGRLSDAVAYSVDLERKAKAAGRNRAIVGARVRSGTDLEWTAAWDNNPQEEFIRILDLYLAGAMPRGFAQDVTAFARDFKDLPAITTEHKHLEYERLCRKKISGDPTALIQLKPESGEYQKFAQLLTQCHFVTRTGGDLE